MDKLLGIIFSPATGIVLAVVAIAIFLLMIYKVAPIDKALIVTGGKEPKIKVSGGAFVIPIFNKHQYFDLCMLTVKAGEDEIKTATAVPIICDWTAQIRPDTRDTDVLKKAAVSFMERGQQGIINDVKLTLTGAVRDIVASMTPEAVLKDKAEFAQKVRETVTDEMNNMGMELVSLNIQDIRDNNGYYGAIATLDIEDKRLAAEDKRAQIDKDIRIKKSVAEENASQAELNSQLAIAAKQRDNNIKKAEFKAETDKANADAAIAGKLQEKIRMEEIVTQEGKIEVVRQEQANLAALKEKEVVLTKAQAEKEKLKVEAEAAANVAEIDAEADAKVKKVEADSKVLVAERAANALKIQAEANAEKIRHEGQASADITKVQGVAEAEVVKEKGLADVEITRMNGLAEAEIVKQKGLAEAEAERAKLMAQADGEKALADARASNEKVNFEIEKIKIEAEARVTIATKTAEIMAEIGKNAEFVNIGGSTNSSNGNVLVDTMKTIPSLMKMLNAENEALNGKSINDEIKGVVESFVEPAKGLLVNTEK